jgi:hypothetical protein
LGDAITIYRELTSDICNPKTGPLDVEREKPERPLPAWLARLLTVTTCGYCGARVPTGEGFRVTSIEVYCSEEHAWQDQQISPI